MTSTQYQEWKEFLNPEPSRRVISEAFLSPPGSCLLTGWVVGVFLFNSNIYLLHRNTLKINSFACHMKYEMCWETDLSHGSSKSSYNAANTLSRKKYLVVSIGCKLLALSLLTEHIRAERKGSHGLCGPQPELVQTASMSWQQVRC